MMSRINRPWFHKKKLIDYKIIIGLLCMAALFAFCVFCLGIFEEKEQEKKPVKDTVAEQSKPSDELEENQVDPGKPMVALTFDDGPSKYTEQLLGILEENQVKASFFLVGQNVGRYPKVIQKMKDLGCDIGNHTMNHRELTKLSVEDIEIQIETVNDAIKKCISEGSTMVRPPYGSEDEKVRESVKYPLILWSVDTNDWQTEDANVIAEYILNTVKDGDIVLLHDIYQSTVDSVAIVIPKLIEKGYQIVSVSELAEARGITLENGKVYGGFYPKEKLVE